MTENDQKSLPDLKSGRFRSKQILLIAALLLFGVLFWLSRNWLNLEYLAGVETVVKDYYHRHPVVVYLLAFAIYALVTGFSIPGATGMSLVYGWFFGFARALVIVSFAAALGATIAFLLCRYFFRQWVQDRYGEQLKKFNEELDRDGAFYLFCLRMTPIAPYFVINAVMGLTRMRVATFWWVTQIGMLPITVINIYAFSQIPDLQTISDRGIEAVIEPSKMVQIMIALTLLGLFPLIAKKFFSKYLSIDQLSDAQQEEVDHRLAEHEKDPQDVVSWEQVKTDAMDRLRKK